MLIIKAGSSVTEACKRFGDFDRWFRNSLGPDRFEFTTVEVFAGEPLPADPAGHGFDGIVITGSPAMVSHRNEWSEATAAWLVEAHRAATPILGVCFGHQLLAQGLGGKVGPNPRGRRMGTRTVLLDASGDELLGGLETVLDFQTTHLEVVVEPPPGARVLATTDGDPHHALHFGNVTWGVQFHPEFDAEIMECYIRVRGHLLEGEGQSYRRILEAIRPAPAGARLMARFADLVSLRAVRDTRSARYA